MTFSSSSLMILDEISRYKQRHAPIWSVPIANLRRMYLVRPMNRTPADLVMPTGYCYDANTTPSMVQEGAFGCTLEPQDPQWEMNIVSLGREVGCQMTSLRWPLIRSPKIFMMRSMTLPIQKMLVHCLASEAFQDRLCHVGTWKGIYTSLFQYHVHSNAMKALHSF